jgi:hypothetical protein
MHTTYKKKLLLVFGLLAAVGFYLVPTRAYADDDIVTVTAQTATGVSGCTANGVPSYTETSLGSGIYKWRYVFDVATGDTSCSATLPIYFAETNQNGVNGQKYTFTASDDSAATWADPDNIFYVQDSGLTTLTTNITLNATGLSGGQMYTYSPSTGSPVCSGGSTCSDPHLYVDDTTNDFGGTIEIYVYVDDYDTLDIKAGDSTGSSGPITPTKALGSGPVWQWQYAYNISAGSSVVDTLPIGLCVYDSDANGDDPGLDKDHYEVSASYDAADSSSNFSSLSPGINPSLGYDIDDGACASGTIDISFDSGTLNTPDTYFIFFTVSTNSSNSSHSGQINYDDCTDLADQSTCGSNDGNDPGPSDQHIVVVITVNSGTSTHSCFLTDGDFRLLRDCGGTTVPPSAHTPTFQIITGGRGKGTIVATNPGQFFFSMIYHNDTGSPVDVDFTVGDLTHVESQGARPVHAATFDDSGFVADEAGFDAAQAGVPCSDPTDDGCTFTVPAHSFIWIVWHADYDQKGQPPDSNLVKANLCTNDDGYLDDQGSIKATLTLKEHNGAQLAECDLEAQGYLKH